MSQSQLGRGAVVKVDGRAESKVPIKAISEPRHPVRTTKWHVLHFKPGKIHSIQVDLGIYAFTAVLYRELFSRRLTGAGPAGIVGASIKAVVGFAL